MSAPGLLLGLSGFVGFFAADLCLFRALAADRSATDIAVADTVAAHGGHLVVVVAGRATHLATVAWQWE